MHDEGINQVAIDSSIELLQSILESEQQQSIHIDDVKEIAYDLISFYELLAEGSDE